MNQDDIKLEGFLFKEIQGFFSKQWHKRWCVLTNEALCSFKTAGDYRKPTEFIRLRECSSVKSADLGTGKENSLYVVTPDETFCLVAGSASEKDTWMSAINNVCLPERICLGASVCLSFFTINESSQSFEKDECDTAIDATKEVEASDKFGGSFSRQLTTDTIDQDAEKDECDSASDATMEFDSNSTWGGTFCTNFSRQLTTDTIKEDVEEDECDSAIDAGTEAEASDTISEDVEKDECDTAIDAAAEGEASDLIARKSPEVEASDTISEDVEKDECDKVIDAAAEVEASDLIARNIQDGTQPCVVVSEDSMATHPPPVKEDEEEHDILPLLGSDLFFF